MTKECPHCQTPLVPVDGSNLDECPTCQRWYLVDDVLCKMCEVI
jgi:hypothetical protein